MCKEYLCLWIHSEDFELVIERYIEDKYTDKYTESYEWTVSIFGYQDISSNNHAASEETMENHARC